MVTVRTFSDYQIVELKKMFDFYIIEKIGRIDESGDLFIQYRGGDGYEGVVKSTSIPMNPFFKKHDAQDTSFEIIEPKQIPYK